MDIPSNNVFHSFAGSDVFHNVIHWDSSNTAWDVLVDLVFISATNCVLRIAVLISSVYALCNVGGKLHNVYEDVIVLSIPSSSYDSIRSCRYYFKRSGGLWQYSGLRCARHVSWFSHFRRRPVYKDMLSKVELHPAPHTSVKVGIVPCLGSDEFSVILFV